MTLLHSWHARYVHSRRVRVLAALAARMLPEGSRTVLDVGCGDGRLAKAVMQLRPELEIVGVDVQVRPDAQIPVTVYDGVTLPFSDGRFDSALLIDVLHHTESPPAALRETARVAPGCTILKDHLLCGFAAGVTLRLMDEVGNRHHGVALPYNYLDQAGWDAAFAGAGIAPSEIDLCRGLYPRPASWIFGRRLHFIAKLEPASA